MITAANANLSRPELPLNGATNPSSTQQGTNPGCFANAPDIGGPLAFSSPDTPGMPAPSARTALTSVANSVDWAA